jgi:hypothetical protein
VRPAFAALLFTMTLPGAELTGSIGAHKPYIDERAGLAGGAALRIPISRRAALRPEFIASSQDYYSHLLGLGSVTFDFTDPDGPAVGYAVAGAGVRRVREKPIGYTYVDRAWMGGVGVRLGGRSRWAAGAEFRVGAPAFPLVTFYAGFRFGR